MHTPYCLLSRRTGDLSDPSLSCISVPMENPWRGHKTSAATDPTCGRGCRSTSRKKSQWKPTRQPSSSHSPQKVTHPWTLGPHSHSKSRWHRGPSAAPPLGCRCPPSARMWQSVGAPRDRRAERRSSHRAATCLNTLVASEGEVETARTLLRGTTATLAW